MNTKEALDIIEHLIESLDCVEDCEEEALKVLKENISDGWIDAHIRLPQIDETVITKEMEYIEIQTYSVDTETNKFYWEDSEGIWQYCNSDDEIYWLPLSVLPDYAADPMNGWIDSKERLPEPFTKVYVLYDFGNQSVAFYNNKQQHWTLNDSLIDMLDIAYWRPLFKAPKK